MTSAFDRRWAGPTPEGQGRAKRPGDRYSSVAGWFRLVALLEAVSWVGLLVGMYFKYLGTPRTEIGVKVFGMTHGLIFVGFVVIALLAGIAFKWAAGTWLLALLASIMPLCSVIFLIWADRTGRMDPSASVRRAGGALGVLPTQAGGPPTRRVGGRPGMEPRAVAQPGQSVSETT